MNLSIAPVHPVVFIVPAFDYRIEEDIVIDRAFAGTEINTHPVSVNAVRGLVGFDVNLCLLAGLGCCADDKTAAAIAVFVKPRILRELAQVVVFYFGAKCRWKR